MVPSVVSFVIVGILYHCLVNFGIGWSDFLIYFQLISVEMGYFLVLLFCDLVTSFMLDSAFWLDLGLVVLASLPLHRLVKS